ncbi:MAG: SGNH/GDSL hydrolase family protein [Spirochaetaceae bacterium]|jgi:lysophospholipase L1-like esterase|nr:SGNH/GDSL hydrolase family protein [Spirochaetaceae bacterium]
MGMIKKAAIFGDSILKGVQLDADTKRYVVRNCIDLDKIGNKHLVSIDNFSMFGCTISKGSIMLQRRLANRPFDIVVLEYGGNDCDFNWQEIAERPDDKHIPHTSLTAFIDTYIKMIHWLKEKCIEPIVTTLPPLEPQKFFDWFCKGLNKDNILKWLGTVNAIYRWQENYSRAIEYIAYKTDTILVDIRGAFLKHFRIDELLCEDGTHPNSKGQSIITETFLNFSRETLQKSKIICV